MTPKVPLLCWDNMLTISIGMMLESWPLRILSTLKRLLPWIPQLVLSLSTLDTWDTFGRFQYLSLITNLSSRYTQRSCKVIWEDLSQLFRNWHLLLFDLLWLFIKMWWLHSERQLSTSTTSSTWDICQVSSKGYSSLILLNSLIPINLSNCGSISRKEFMVIDWSHLNIWQNTTTWCSISSKSHLPDIPSIDFSQTILKTCSSAILPQVWMAKTDSMTWWPMTSWHLTLKKVWQLIMITILWWTWCSSRMPWSMFAESLVLLLLHQVMLCWSVWEVLENNHSADWLLQWTTWLSSWSLSALPMASTISRLICKLFTKKLV